VRPTTTGSKDSPTLRSTPLGVNDWHAAADRLNGNYAAIIRSGEWGTAHLAGRLGNQARPHVQHATPHWFATQVV
jgi:hypothetical protein